MKPNPTFPTLTLLFVAAAFVSLAALVVLGDVHHLKAKAHRLPKDLAQRLKLDQHNRQLPKGLEKQLKALNRGADGLHLGLAYDITKVNPKLALTHNRADANNNNNNNNTPADQGGSTVPLESLYNTFLIAKISLGTPPQNFSVLVWNSYDLEVLNTGARSDDNCDTLTGTSLFNGTASSTFQISNTNYTEWWGDVVGTVASDTVSIGSLQVPNVQFGLLDTAACYFSDYSIDGVLGIAVSSVPDVDEPNAAIKTPLLNQLAASGQLSQPIITQLYGTDDVDESGNAEITIGADHSERCSPPTSYPSNVTDCGLPVFNITSISAGNSASRAVNYQVAILREHWPIFVDNATVQLFIEAVGATFKQNGYFWSFYTPLYTVSDEKLVNGQNISLTAANGQVVTLQPRDLVVPYGDGDGDNLLYVFDEALLGVSDEDNNDDCGSSSSGVDNDDASNAVITDKHTAESSPPEPKWLYLGQNYLNNHCVSTNINTGVVGLGDVVG